MVVQENQEKERKQEAEEEFSSYGCF